MGGLNLKLFSGRVVIPLWRRLPSLPKSILIPKSITLKYILPFLFIMGACTHPTPKRNIPFKEALFTSVAGDTVILKKLVNGQPVEIFTLTDSILLFSSEHDKNDTFPFKDFLKGFNDSMDLNGDGYKELIIYGNLNMHGQMKSYIFLSDKEGKLHYRPDLSHYNIRYDTTKKLVTSFYPGGAYSPHSKEIYTWENDSLQLIRGISLCFISPEKGSILKFYADKNETPYKTVTGTEENLAGVWDTSLFQLYPEAEMVTQLP